MLREMGNKKTPSFQILLSQLIELLLLDANLPSPYYQCSNVILCSTSFI